MSRFLFFGQEGAPRGSSLDMDLFTTYLAVQNLWLAVHPEGVGVGFSILDEAALAREL